MKYIVFSRRFIRGVQWRQNQYEFDSLDEAKAKAKELYDTFDASRGDEVAVQIYELIESASR